MRNTFTPDDVLLFHHIPKTGGLSLISILDGQFPEEEILPLHSAPSTDIWEIYSPEQKSRFRLIRGHFTFIEGDQHIYKHITQNPIRITMMRDPIARIQSGYRYNRRNPNVEVHVKKIIVKEGENFPLQNPEDEQLRQEKHEQALKYDFSDFLQLATNAKEIYNTQTRFIQGSIPGYPERIENPHEFSDDEVFAMVKVTLDSFAFVGISEHFVESVQLLCELFGWPMVDHVPRLNVNPHTSEAYQFTEKDLEVAHAYNSIDKRLYSQARELFFERVQMMKRLGGVEWT